MDDKVVEVAAPSADEAVIIGLTRMGATRDEVDIEILNEGSRGFLGFGAHEARVRLTRRDVPQAPPPPVERVVRPASDVKPAASAFVASAEKVTPEPVRPSPVVASEPATAEPASAAPVVSEPASAESKPERASAKPPSSRGRSRSRRSRSRDREREPARNRDVARDQARDYEDFSAEENDFEPGDADFLTTAATGEPLRLGDLDCTAIEKAALDVAGHLFDGLQITVLPRWRDEDRPTLWLSVRGRDADMLVGPRAQTLNSVQYLFRSLMHHQIDGNYNVVMDADGYRRRRNHNLESLASRVAEQAIRTGRTIRMRPMPANERRIIHMILRKDERVETESVGRGRNRAITVIPVKKSEK